MMQEKLDDLKNRAHELDAQIADFTAECKLIAKELTDRLSKRRKKYDITVEIVEMFDFARYQIDFFISAKDSDSIYYVFTIDLDGDLDEEQILKECDRLYDEIYGK